MVRGSDHMCCHLALLYSVATAYDQILARCLVMHGTQCCGLCGDGEIGVDESVQLQVPEQRSSSEHTSGWQWTHAEDQMAASQSCRIFQFGDMFPEAWYQALRRH